MSDKPQKWVMVPRPGEMRGEGRWMKLGDTLYTEEQWNAIRATSFLPTAESDEHPEESRN